MKLASLLLLAFLLSGQNADVTILQPADAKEARAAYLEMKTAEQKWAELGKRFNRVYGIEYQTEFSKDFTALVPKSRAVTAGSSWGNGGTLQMWPCSPNNITLTSGAATTNITGTLQ